MAGHGQNTSGIENIIGIERRFYPAHGRKGRRVFITLKIPHLHPANAMFRRNRAAHFHRKVMHHAADVSPAVQKRRLVCPFGLGEIGMQITVAQMSENTRANPRHSVRQLLCHLLDKLGNSGLRQGKIMLDGPTRIFLRLGQ